MISDPLLDFTVQIGDAASALADEDQLNAWCLATLQHAMTLDATLQPHTSWQITARIVDAEEGKMLNTQYRQKNYATNVLSFYYDDPFTELNFLEDEDERMRSSNVGLGDIILCAPVIIQEAQEQKKSVHEHTAHLMVHATLHLLGYDHETEKDAAFMENLETVILKHLGFNNPYEEI